MSTTKLVTLTDRGFPCFTRASIFNPFVYSLLILTLVLVLIRVKSINFINFLELHIALNILLIYSYIRRQTPVHIQQINNAGIY